MPEVLTYKKEGLKTQNSDNCNNYHAVSLSGGKDSSCDLLLLIEKDMPIDIVLTADVGMEFPEIHEYLAKMDISARNAVFISPLCGIYRASSG